MPKVETPEHDLLMVLRAMDILGWRMWHTSQKVGEYALLGGSPLAEARRANVILRRAEAMGLVQSIHIDRMLHWRLTSEGTSELRRLSEEEETTE